MAPITSKQLRSWSKLLRHELTEWASLLWIAYEFAKAHWPS